MVGSRVLLGFKAMEEIFEKLQNFIFQHIFCKHAFVQKNNEKIAKRKLKKKTQKW